MKKMAEIWDGAQKDVQKLIGKDAALPYWPADPNAIGAEYNASQDDVEAATKALLDACQDQAAIRSEFTEALAKLNKVASKSDFGLDSKSKDDAKKINEARKVLATAIGAMQKRADVVAQTNRNTLEKAFKSIK